MSFYTRLYDFLAGATVRSQEFDDEFNAIQGGFASVEAKALQVPDANTLTLPNAAGRANKLLFFDASGNATATNNVPDPVADMDVANRRWVQTLALTGTITVGPGDTGKVMSNNGSTVQWTTTDALFPSMAGKAGYALLTDGSARYWGKVVWMVAYDNRADLRAATGVQLDSLALVDGLGVFQHMAGVDEGPDDDETAFATAGGYWVLVCPSWDVVDAMTLLDGDEQNARLAESESFAARFLQQTSAQSAFTLAINSSTTFTVTVWGAALGASVIVTPPTDPTLNTITLYARVTAINTVTVYIGNASAASTGGFGAGDWQFTVVNKE